MTRAAKGARSWRECRAHRSCGEGGRATASTGPGQKSHVERRKASVPVAGYAGRLTQIGSPVCEIDRTPGPPAVRNERKARFWPRLRIERGVCMPVMACRSGCVACIQAPPALRTLLNGGSEMEGKGREEKGK